MPPQVPQRGTQSRRTGRPWLHSFWSGFGDTLDRLTAQNMKGISFLVERLYAG